MQRIKLYDNLQAAIKSVKYRVIVKLKEGEPCFRISKDDLSEDGEVIVRSNYLEEGEVVFNYCDSESQARALISFYPNLPLSVIGHTKAKMERANCHIKTEYSFNSAKELLNHIRSYKNRGYKSNSEAKQSGYESEVNYYDTEECRYYIYLDPNCRGGNNNV